MDRVDDGDGGVIAEDGYFAAIVDSALDAIVSKNVDGIVRSWNPAAQRLFGWTAEEMVGHSIRRLIPADRQHEEDEILARVRAGELVRKFETLRQHKGGQLLPVAITVSPIRGRAGEIIGASKIAHEIGEQLAMRARLAESEERFRALADNIPQLAWMANGEGWIFWYNRRWFEYTGTTLDEMAGWGWRAVHHPDHVDRVVERIQHSWDTGTPWEDTFPLRGTDGNYRWFLSRALPIRDEAGVVRLWFGTNTDVTQQREHERQVELLMGELTHRSKNMLAMIQALVRRTVTPDVEGFLATFDDRLGAIGANLDLLTRRGWSGAGLEDVIRSQLSWFPDLVGARVDLEGPPDLVLLPAAAEAIGLAIHELATNAGKYGALSNASGRVAIQWSVEPGDGGSLALSWSEHDGPPVAEPARHGFGTALITRNPAATLGAEIDLRFAPAGLEWELRAPAARVLAAG